jgi:hypothetical protein
MREDGVGTRRLGWDDEQKDEGKCKNGAEMGGSMEHTR